MVGLSVAVIVLLFSVPSSGLLILLQFDGSLRPPSDVGMPTCSLGKLAACACSIRVMDSICNFPPIPLLLGGKGLSAASLLNSGDVEYEGLLLGLESLQMYLTEFAKFAHSNNFTILIQGDCKSVLNQMNGRAIPRKLVRHHQRACAAVCSIKDEMLIVGISCTFEYQHIPRTNNVLCDRVSASIIVQQQRMAINDVWNTVKLLESSDHYVNAGGVEGILARYLQQGKSLIPLSMRPPLYQRLVALAISMQDYSGLLAVAILYEEDICLQRQKMSTADHSFTLYEAYRANAVRYQILALEALNRFREGIRKEHKHRILLKNYPRGTLQMERQAHLPLSNVSATVKCDKVTCNVQYGVDWPARVLQWENEAYESNTWKENCKYLSYQQIVV